MPVGDLLTAAGYQFEFADVLFGRLTGDELVECAGLDLPEIRDADLTRPRDHGLIAGTDYLEGRIIDVELQVFGASADDLADRLAALAVMGSPIGATETPLVFWLPGETKRRVNCRLRKRAFPITEDHYEQFTNVALQFKATDPRIYSNDETVLPITLPASSGGLDWPVEWPLAWGTATSGVVTATNEGTFESRPVVTFIGPLNAPTIENVTTGETWASTIDIASGDELIVDFDARTVLLNGTASRYSFVKSTSVWWVLAPGDNQIRLGAASGSGSAEVAYRSAWI